MRQASRAVVAAVTALLLVAQTSLASGVGDASWTPSQSSTTSRDSRFLIPGDAVVFRTDAVWDRQQADGLGIARIPGQGPPQVILSAG